MSIFVGVFLVIGVGVFSIDATRSVYAAAGTITSVQEVPIDFTQFVPCANNGQGEYVHVTGTEHVVVKLTSSNGEDYLFHRTINPHGATGTGLTTGDKYQFTGVSQLTDLFRYSELQQSGQLVFTGVSRFQVIGEGPENNFIGRATAHYTVFPDLTVTVDFSNFSIECK
jgi:hypothetical protein